MILQNPGWVGYFDRTYDQLKENILQKFQFLVPEITDDTETNPWVKGVSIWTALVELLGYYIDTSAREFFLPAAKEFASAVLTAMTFDYRVRGATPATVTLRFRSNIAASADIVIPAGTRTKTANNEVFTTTSSGTILMGTTFIDIPAKQMDAVNNVALGNSTGLPNQLFVLEEDVVDNSVSILVDVVPYQAQDTFAFSIPTDTHFIAGLQGDTKMTVLFGDAINGKVPPSGKAITASYFVTLGLAGNNIGSGKITTLISVITVPGSEVITVNNAAAATGGADAEDLGKLQKRIPYSIRTRWRAVTPDDFRYVTELFLGVERAGIQFDCEIDPYVNIFIVPDGGGLASGGLLADVTSFMNIRKVINTKIKVQPAGQLQFVIVIDAVALPGYSNATTATNIRNELLDFFLPENQLIKDKVAFGDLYQHMEEAVGVQYTNISSLKVIPFARNLVSPANVLNWTRSINAASNLTIKWLIRFITNSQFEFFKEDDFMGTFNVDTPIVMDEINLTVNGNHLGGDNYEFYTYAVNASVFLAEPSIPALLTGNLTVNVTGGV